MSKLDTYTVVVVQSFPARSIRFQVQAKNRYQAVKLAEQEADGYCASAIRVKR